MTEAAYLSMQGLSKAYPGVVALAGRQSRSATGAKPWR